MSTLQFIVCNYPATCHWLTTVTHSNHTHCTGSAGTNHYMSCFHQTLVTTAAYSQETKISSTSCLSLSSSLPPFLTHFDGQLLPAFHLAPEDISKSSFSYLGQSCFHSEVHIIKTPKLRTTSKLKYTHYTTK